MKGVLTCKGHRGLSAVASSLCVPSRMPTSCQSCEWGSRPCSPATNHHSSIVIKCYNWEGLGGLIPQFCWKGLNITLFRDVEGIYSVPGNNFGWGCLFNDGVFASITQAFVRWLHFLGDSVNMPHPPRLTMSRCETA